MCPHFLGCFFPKIVIKRSHLPVIREGSPPYSKSSLFRITARSRKWRYYSPRRGVFFGPKMATSKIDIFGPRTPPGRTRSGPLAPRTRAGTWFYAHLKPCLKTVISGPGSGPTGQNWKFPAQNCDFTCVLGLHILCKNFRPKNFKISIFWKIKF